MEETGPTAEPEPSAETRCCWRCRKFYSPALARACPFCGAPLEHSVPLARGDGPGEEGRTMSRLMIAFGLMMLVSIVFNFSGRAYEEGEIAASPEIAKEVLTALSAAELVFSIIVLVTVFKLRRSVPWRPEGGQPTLGWMLMLPLLAAALTVNLSYHAWLQDLLEIPNPDEELVTHRSLLPWIIVVICVQPAIIEELFFRYLCLGAMRPLMGTGAAIFVSSLLFGIAHLGVIISMPALVFVGVVIAYARIISGSILLPITIHFLHNLVIVFVAMKSSG